MSKSTEGDERTPEDGMREGGLFEEGVNSNNRKGQRGKVCCESSYLNSGGDGGHYGGGGGGDVGRGGEVGGGHDGG